MIGAAAVGNSSLVRNRFTPYSQHDDGYQSGASSRAIDRDPRTRVCFRCFEIQTGKKEPTQDLTVTDHGRIRVCIHRLIVSSAISSSHLR